MATWGPLEEPIYALTKLRTEYWTDQLVGRLDERNRTRMMCLPPVWQEHVVRTYSTKDGQEVRDEARHIAGTITGVRRLLYGGITEGELVRLQALAQAGTRISYLLCTQWEAQGTCRYGASCTHPHVGHRD